MGFERIKIESQDGASIEALYFQSPQSDTLYLCLPAMGVSAKYYVPMAEVLVKDGQSVLLCDLRGQGSSNRKAPKAKFGYHQMLTLDLPAYIASAKSLSSEAKIVILGHSLGGHLGLLYAAQNPEAVQALVLIASGSVYYKAYRFPQSLKIWIGTQSSVLLSTLFGYFPGHKIGFGGKQPKRIMRDWARQGRTGRFAPKDSDFDYEAALGNLSLPIFALSLASDKFAPHSATDHLIGKAKQADVIRLKFIPSAKSPKIDHFRWVKHSEEIIAELLRWVEGF